MRADVQLSSNGRGDFRISEEPTFQSYFFFFLILIMKL